MATTRIKGLKDGRPIFGSRFQRASLVLLPVLRLHVKKFAPSDHPKCSKNKIKSKRFRLLENKFRNMRALLQKDLGRSWKDLKTRASMHFRNIIHTVSRQGETQIFRLQPGDNINEIIDNFTLGNG